MRRLVAKRSLNALGGVSGLAGFVNDAKQLAEIQQNLRFAESFEAIKTAEKDLKKLKAKQKRDSAYAVAKRKVKLRRTEKFYKKHAAKLTMDQMKAVAFIDYDGVQLSGKCAEIREQLLQLLPSDDDVENSIPEYETQDDFDNSLVSVSDDDSDSDSSSSIAVACSLKLEDLVVGQTVQVYWVGDDQWYEGDATGVDIKDRQFEVLYSSDSQQLWHNTDDYQVRICC